MLYFLRVTIRIQRKKIVIDELKKEYKAGDIVGKCEVYLGSEKVGEVDIYCDRDVKKGNIIDNIKYNIKNLFEKGVQPNKKHYEFYIFLVKL